MKRRNGLAATFALLPMLVPHHAFAKQSNAAYVAQSKTAMSITGDIELSPSRLGMARGISLRLEVVARARRFNTDQGDELARILRVTNPTNPVLLNNNRLCEAPVTWIVTWQMPERGLGLAAFSGTEEPKSEDSPGLCGTFFYGAR